MNETIMSSEDIRHAGLFADALAKAIQSLGMTDDEFARALFLMTVRKDAEDRRN